MINGGNLLFQLSPWLQHQDYKLSSFGLEGTSGRLVQLPDQSKAKSETGCIRCSPVGFWKPLSMDVTLHLWTTCSNISLPFWWKDIFLKAIECHKVLNPTVKWNSRNILKIHSQSFLIITTLTKRKHSKKLKYLKQEQWTQTLK